MRDNRAFVKVDMGLVQDIGLDAAFLYGLIRNISNIRAIDDDGYFAIETEYLSKVSCWSKKTVVRHRLKLVDAGLLRLKNGVNQNIKVKYKIIHKL